MCKACAFLLNKATSHAQNHTTETFDHLAGDLNANGYRTCRGTPYKGGDRARGVAHLVARSWLHHTNRGDNIGAYRISQAFTDRNGNLAHY